jgi:transcriptional regulator with XRE-family HTH domain
MLLKPLAKVVGENIACRRRKLGLTQRQLAEILDIGQDALSRMEKGTISPKIGRLRDMASILKCSPASFFREQDEDARQRAETLAELIRPLPAAIQDTIMLIVREIVDMIQKDMK